MVDMDITKVLAHLPQRYPLLMVDRVLECEPGKRILAVKNVSANEPHFLGHFPGRPIMPGVLILEAMAQAACILALRTKGEVAGANTAYYYAGIDGARFKRPVVPGDQLQLEVHVLAHKRGIWKFSCVARVAGAVVTEAEILCTERILGQE
jgi:3-hydroxyacyl-[acyl-carrier-protein] dehydratase